MNINIFCLQKIVTEVPLIGTTIARSCDNTCKESGVDAGIAGVNTYCCSSDLCNSSSVVKINVGFILAVALMKLFKAY